MARNWFYNEYSNSQLYNFLEDYCYETDTPMPDIPVNAGRCTLARAFESLNIDFAGF